MATEVTQFSKHVFQARGPLPAEPTLRERAMEVFAKKLADPEDEVNRLHGGWTRIHTVRVFGGPDEFQFDYGLLNPAMFQKKVLPPKPAPAPKIDRTAEIRAAKELKAKQKAEAKAAFDADKAKKLAEKKALEAKYRLEKKMVAGGAVVVTRKAMMSMPDGTSVPVGTVFMAGGPPDKPPKPKRQKKVRNSRPPNPATR